MKTNNYPTAVYLQDGKVFRLIMVENMMQPVTAKRGQVLKRNIDDIGMLSMHSFSGLDKIVSASEKPNVKVLRPVVEDITEDDLAKALFGVLRLNFRLLDMSVAHQLFPSQDRAEMGYMGFEFVYSVCDGHVTESAYYSVETNQGWANYLTRCAAELKLESTTVGGGFAFSRIPEIYQPVTWVVKASKIEDARIIHKWACGLNTVKDVHLACLHEGEDRRHFGQNPLMAYVWADGKCLTCFAKWDLDPELNGKTARDFDGRQMFIKVTKPWPGSGRTAGSFTLVSEQQLRELVGIAQGHPTRLNG